MPRPHLLLSYYLYKMLKFSSNDAQQGHDLDLRP